MNINNEQLQRQKEGADIWIFNKCNGVLNYATGVGKSFTTSLAINKLEELGIKESILIVVPSEALEKQWKRKLPEYFNKSIINRILVITIHTLVSEKMVYEVGTVVYDEVHEYTSEERIDVITNKIKAKRRLGLTASVQDKSFRNITNIMPIIDVITLEEAQEKGFIAKIIEYNLGLELSNKEEETYKKLSEVISTYMPKFNNNIELAQKVLSGGKDRNGNYYSGSGFAYALALQKGWKPNLDLNNPDNVLVDNLWNPSLIIGFARRLLNAVRARKDLLSNSNIKIITTLEILNKIDKVKTIVFSESIEFAEKINTVLNNNNHKSVVYHSKLKTKMITSPKSGKLIKYGATRQKKDALDSINKGIAKVLVTTKALDKGLDQPDIRMGINASGSQAETQDTQRRGRTARKEHGTSIAELPVLMINLYIKNTQDEIWVQSRQRNLSHKPIEIASVGEITYTPPTNNEFDLKDL